MAAGADMTRIVSHDYVMGDDWIRRRPTLEDLDAIAVDIREVEARVIFIVALVAFLPSGTNIYNDMQVRKALEPFTALLAEMGAAGVGVRHLHKRASGNPINAGGGSIGFAGAAQSVLLCGKDPDDPTEERRVLARSKSNLAGQVPALAFRLKAAGRASRIDWLGESRHTAESLLVQNHGGSGAGDEARGFLLDRLSDGAVGRAELFDRAREEGLAKNTLRRAADKLGIKKTRGGFGPGSKVYWELPCPTSTREQP